ncbi:MAG: chemotaxis protein CheA [Rhodanobacter sp.]
MDDVLDNELQKDFLIEAGELLLRLGAQLVRLESSPDDQKLLDAAFRTFHSVKGGAGFLALEPLVLVCHRAEELLKNARDHTTDLTTVQLDALLEAVDVLTAMLGELADGVAIAAPPTALLRLLWPDRAACAASVPASSMPSTGAPPAIDDDEFEALLDSLHGNRAPGSREVTSDRAGARPVSSLQPLATARVDTPAAGPQMPASQRVDSKSMVHVETARLDGLAHCVDALMAVRTRLTELASHDAAGALAPVVAELDRVAEDLKMTVSDLRMQPIGRLFQRFPRVVRDLARKLGKEAELVLRGGDTDLDRSITEPLADALVHLLRNAVDHGIGMPDERMHAGKSPRGRITLAASLRDGCVVIAVSDDGRGMDPETLRRHALDKGLLDAAAIARLTVSESFDLVFRPGFSTAEAASDISGRGFGMDVVKTRLAELGGSIELRSARGLGTEVEMRIPLARTALPVLVVTAGTLSFALPTVDVEEVFELAAGHETTQTSPRILRHRGRMLSLVTLSGWPFAGNASGRWVVVLRNGLHHVGCLVDAVLQREDVVSRPLGPMFAGLPGISGTAVLGDGELALVVDTAILLEREGAPLPCLQMKA